MFAREWRNWQTRTFEGRVVFTVRVQFPFPAPNSRNPNPRRKPWVRISGFKTKILRRRYDAYDHAKAKK